MQLKVIDVSKWQGKINWQKAKEDGVKAALIRVGYGSWISGGKLDVRFVENMEAAHRAGIPIGIYFYSRAITDNHIKKETQWALDQLKNYKDVITWPVALDVEYEKQKNVSRKKLTDMCCYFLSQIRQAGYTPILYASKSWLQTRIDTSRIDADIWLAHYTTKTSYTGHTIWQYSSKGRINGISGNVDMNHAYKNYATGKECATQITLVRKNRGPAVQKLQKELNQLGYNAGVEDGIFGGKTEKALKVFQEANGLEKDGIFGPITQKTLDKKLEELANAPTESINPYYTSIQRTLKKGYKGADVETLQTLLTEARVDPGEVDGIFGRKTDEATRQYQASKGLIVDGVVGKMTLAKLLAR